MNDQREPRSIEFDESRLGDLSGLANALFEDESDPRSLHYKRHFVRPEISWGKIACAALLPVALGLALSALMTRIGVAPRVVGIILLAMALVYLLCILKPLAITLVRIYQRYAPTSIREKCRFEPSCSEYMILAIQKYGLVRGVARGIKRLRRCNPQGGGFDWP